MAWKLVVSGRLKANADFTGPAGLIFTWPVCTVRRPPSTLKLECGVTSELHNHHVNVVELLYATATIIFMHQRDTNTLAQHVGWKKINAVDGGYRWLLLPFIFSMLCISDQRSSIADDHIFIETAEYEIILSTENDSNTED